MDKHLKKLEQQIDGDVLTDTLSRMLYATDASPYQQRPLAIARPRHTKDCVNIIKFAANHKYSLIPRAAGTSLAGQCVGEGIIVDVSRYMNRVISIDTKTHTATVEPGVICNHLNLKLRKHGLMFAPDPSTSNYCTIGGMMGNNAWGIHSQRYGTTRDNTIQVEVVLSDGSSATFGPVNAETLEQKLQLENREGDIYRCLFEMINKHHKQIQQCFPAPDGLIRNSGYALDKLVQGQPWQAKGPLFNIAPFLCGSEGTLVFVTAIEVKLVPIPKQRLLVCAHFDNLDTALKSVSQILPFKPAALEIIDHNILKRTENNLKQKANRFWLEGNPAAVLLVEFHQDSITAKETLEDTIDNIRAKTPAYAFTVVEPEKIDQVWALRKAGLGLLMGAKGPVKGVTGIEDAAIKTTDLPAYVNAVKKILSQHDTDCIVYGPAGRGTLHLRPELNLNIGTDRQKYREILDQVCDLVIQFKGSISGKHGDGRLRAYYLERLLGSDMISLLQQVKNTFDPLAILNPKTILNTPLPEQNLRFNTIQTETEIQSFFDWSSESGLKTAAQKCNGAGVCLQRTGTGTMCPSYMVTREEKHGTRGRANIFRQILESSNPKEAMSSPYIKEALDLCISCKGCKSECPANVDMAQMKAEFLQHYHDQHGIPFRSKVIANFANLSHYASFLPVYSNTLFTKNWVKKTLGFHPQRNMPKLSPFRFSHWWKKHTSPPKTDSQTELVIIIDPVTEYYEPNIAIAAISVLETLDFNITVMPCMSLGRVKISQGLLRQAKADIVKAINLLHPYAEAGVALISLEPSELITLHDEAKVLFKDEDMKTKAEIVSRQAFLFDEFIANNQQLINKKIFKLNQIPEQILVHAHCQQKSLLGIESTKALLSLLPNANIDFIPSGCCGMAGSFGYEKEHYEISLQIAELELMPAIRKASNDTVIVATGTSCRHQISDLAGIQALHPAEVLAKAMKL